MGERARVGKAVMEVQSPFGQGHRVLAHAVGPLWNYERFRNASTARRKSSAIGAPVAADSFFSFATVVSGSQTVVRFFFTRPIFTRMSNPCVFPEPRMAPDLRPGAC